MSFCLDVSSPVLRSEPCLLRVTDWLFPCWTRPCVYRWATTQVGAHTHTYITVTWVLIRGSDLDPEVQPSFQKSPD